MLLQLSTDPVVYWAEVRTVGWPESGVSWVNSGTDFMHPVVKKSNVLSAKVTS